MGVTKSSSFTERQNRIALWAKALGHPARIAIIEYLLKANSCICTDLVEELPLAQATVSQHLKELKNVGLIKGEIEGPKVCYCINPVVWHAVKTEFFVLFESYTPVGDSCC